MKMILFEQHIKTVIAIAIIYLMASTKLFAQMPKFDYVKQLAGIKSLTFPKDIAVDKNGNTYTIGTFQNVVDFDPGVGVYNLIDSGIGSGFIVKLNNNGQFIWAKKISNPTVHSGSGVSIVLNSIVLDTSDNPVFTGLFGETIDFDPGPASFNLTAANQRNSFICKLDTAGNFKFAKAYTGIFTWDLACDNKNNIYTTGQGIYNFQVGSESIYIAKFDALGNNIWVKHMEHNYSPSILYEYGSTIEVDENGNVFTTGQFVDSTDFDPGPNVYKLYAVGHLNNVIDVFVCKLDSNGNFIWAKQFGKKDYTYSPNITHILFATDLILDKNNNVITTGFYSTEADFDPGIGTFELKTSTQGVNTYICKLDNNGMFIWAKQFDSYNTNIGGLNLPTCIATDSCNNIYTCGIFHETVDMDPSTNEFFLTINADHSDISTQPQVGYISKLNENGNFIWAGKIEGELVNPASICLDKNNNIFTTGMFYNFTDFNPDDADTNCVMSIKQDAFIHKLNQDCAIDTNISINNFTVTVAQLNASYQWINCTTGNAIAGANNQSFTATENGTYAVMITLNECCHATSNCIAIKNIGVVPHGSLYVPNAFSPNGDGVNPTFIPIINGQIKADAYKMIVFNRWGNQVFTSNDISKGWDGLQHGMPCEMGTYFYYIECQTLDNQTLMYKGDVMLLK
jgi:gliding motility-associated-like protein